MKKFKLENTRIEPPFKSPENYFEDFSTKLQKRIEGETEPEGVSKKSPFGVPERYFDILPQKIMNRVTSLRKKVWYKERVTWQWATLACSFLALIWFGQNFWWHTHTSPIGEAEAQLLDELKKIDDEEVEQYLVANKNQDLLLEELRKYNVEVKEMPKKKLNDTSEFLENLPKKDLEEFIPEDMLQEIVEEELGGESNEVIFSEKDTMSL
ncbi:MAG: hypothetical protein OHK0045_03550 [Raineya sp.]